jgi:transposase InsO family protein
LSEVGTNHQVLEFGSLSIVREARLIVENWRTAYNEVRPQHALNHMTPAAYAAGLAPNHGEAA